MGEKPSDKWAVPLNHVHHMAQHAHGDELGWWSAQGVDPFTLAIKLYKKYASQRPKTGAGSKSLKRRTSIKVIKKGHRKPSLSKIKSFGFRKDGPKRKISSRGFKT